MTIYPKQFYVYMYLREDGTPYYIGKGTGRRAWKNTGRTWSPPADKSRIVIHTEDLTEDQALSLEIELIAEYGRKDNGTGILRNRTDGGEGLTGISEKTRQKMSEAKKGRTYSKVHRENMSNSHKKRCSVNGIWYESVQDAADAHNIKYTTAKWRAQNKSKGWSY